MIRTGSTVDDPAGRPLSPRFEADSRVDEYGIVPAERNPTSSITGGTRPAEGVLMPAGTSLKLVHNTDRDRFELWDSETFMGLVGYEKDGDVYILLHTVIEERYGQQGIARLL